MTVRSILFGIGMTAGLFLLLGLVACTKGEPYVVEYKDSATKECKFITVDSQEEDCIWLKRHNREPDDVVLGQSAAMDKWRQEEKWPF